MRTLLVCCCFLVTSVLSAQITTCLNTTPQVRGLSKVSLKPTSAFENLHSVKRSPYQPAVGISQYLFDGQSSMAPAMGVQYVPKDNSSHKLTFSGGLVWSPGSSSVVETSRFSGDGRYQFSTIDGVYGNSNPSLSLGYLGGEYRYYFLPGDVQPYVGAGAYFLGWKYGPNLGSTLAPSVLGGVSAEISTVFSGYVELRQLFGVGTILGNSTFGGSTTVSAGFASAPQFTNW